jgi:hypothetical protein
MMPACALFSCVSIKHTLYLQEQMYADAAALLIALYVLGLKTSVLLTSIWHSRMHQ